MGNYGYSRILPAQAKAIMDEQSDYILLDVRTEYEFSRGHIEDAILIPCDEIGERAEEELPDKDALILIYCRSGRRSRVAAHELASMGYTNVKEFGGILYWPYDIER